MLGEIALGAAPIAGGALLGALAGGLRGPDYRKMIKDDMELLERIPAENAELREGLKRSIETRIEDLIVSADRSRQLREVAASYRGNWRDIIVFVCAVMFTVVWWNVPHERTNWLVMFVFLILLSVLAGLYAARGTARALRSLRYRTPAG